MQQYGLTAAPASQPRNAIVGQAVALVIAQLIGTRTDMDIWLKQSVATSLAIAVMAKLGVIHPPAGTHPVCLALFPISYIRPGCFCLPPWLSSYRNCKCFCCIFRFRCWRVTVCCWSFHLDTGSNDAHG